MPTKNGSLISKFLKELIEEDSPRLDIDRVYLGDQRVLAHGTVVCVEPSRKTSAPYSTGQFMNHDFQTAIIVYKSGDQGIENVQFEADQLTEEIEDLINKSASAASLGLGGTQLGNNITNGWCTNIDHGYRVPTSQITRANRIIFTSRSRTSLLGD